MKALGIDPGTKSFDLCLLNSRDEIIFEETVPSEKIREEPEKFVKKILSLEADIIIAPSGYGLPLKKFSELKEDEKFLITLVKEKESIPVLDGMKRAFSILENKVEMVFIPGVIHLPTVPRYRKFNKIDMGTADKLAVCFLCIEMHSRLKNKSYDEISFSLLELGYGYNAAFAIYKGKIIDGIGGTNFPGPAFLNSGAMDGELAYLLGEFKKSLLFEGGVSFFAEGKPMNPEDFTPERYKDEFHAFCEGLLRALLITSHLSSSKLVYLSGRLTSFENIYEPVKKYLYENRFEVRKIPKLSQKVKEAAQGEAMIGLGLLGVKYDKLLKHMEIDKASGTVFNNIYWREKIKWRQNLIL